MKMQSREDNTHVFAIAGKTENIYTDVKSCISGGTSSCITGDDLNIGDAEHSRGLDENERFTELAMSTAAVVNTSVTQSVELNHNKNNFIVNLVSRKRVWEVLTVLSLTIIICIVVALTLFCDSCHSFHLLKDKKVEKSSRSTYHNTTDRKASTEQGCMKTSSNEVFMPVSRYTDSDIEKLVKRGPHRYLLKKIAYDLTDIQRQAKHWKYVSCVHNPLAAEKNIEFEVSYMISSTLIYFNLSKTIHAVIYMHIPIIDVDCNFNVYLSPVTVWCRYDNYRLPYIMRIRRLYLRKQNKTVTLPAFTKYREFVSIPGVQLVFQYTATMQRYSYGTLQEEYPENGEVIVDMALENSISQTYILDDDFHVCLR